MSRNLFLICVAVNCNGCVRLVALAVLFDLINLCAVERRIFLLWLIVIEVLSPRNFTWIIITAFCEEICHCAVFKLFDCPSTTSVNRFRVIVAVIYRSHLFSANFT